MGGGEALTPSVPEASETKRLPQPHGYVLSSGANHLPLGPSQASQCTE